MEKDRTEITRRILNFTLEIIYLLTGEDYAVVKKTSGDSRTPIIHIDESGEYCESRNLFAEPPPHLPIHEQKILDLTNKMIELLTGEVPIRCQDVTVYFSMKEWEYLEGHKDLYKDIIMETYQPLKSPDASSRLNPPERYPSPLYSEDGPEENPSVPDIHQDENQMDIKVEIIDDSEEEAADLRDDDPYGLMESTQPDGCSGPLYSQDCPEENRIVPEDQGEDLIHIKVEVEAEERKMMGEHPCMSNMEEDIPVDITSDGSSRLNPPERYPSPLYSEDCPEENPSVPDIHQDENQMDIKVEIIDYVEEEAADLRDDDPYGLMESNPPERCLGPLYSQDCPEENRIVPEDKGEDLIHIKVEVEAEEGKMMGEHPCMSNMEEDIPVDITSETAGKDPDGNFMFLLNYKVEDESILQPSSGENFLTLFVQPALHSTNLSYSLPSGEQTSPNLSQIVTASAGLKRFQCGECGKQFNKSSDIVLHRRTHTGEKPYSCSECGKCFTAKSNLVTHERIHTGEKLHSCSLCEKCFTDKSSLVRHERSHRGEKPYLCLECGKGFVQRSDLVKHERIHTGEKLYSCLECRKCFTSKSNLITHERIHTGERLYSCSDCGKCFTSKSNQIRHERSHTGEKPFSCSACEKCFITNAKLKDHQRSHTGEKPYSCLLCGKCFTKRAVLVTHERSHTGEKPYSCSECEKCFINKGKLSDHRRRRHSRKKPC